jgi:hypothetical protein
MGGSSVIVTLLTLSIFITLAKSSALKLTLSPTSAAFAIPPRSASMLTAGERSAVSFGSSLGSEQEVSVAQINRISANARQARRDVLGYRFVLIIDIPPDFFF